MTVYVDDAAIAGTVGRITSRWSQLIADHRTGCTRSPTRSGPRLAWLQDPLTKAGGSRPAQNWHYHVTAGKRGAGEPGTVAVSWRELAEVRGQAPRWDAAKRRAAQQDESVSEVIRRALPSYVDQAPIR